MSNFKNVKKKFDIEDDDFLVKLMTEPRRSKKEIAKLITPIHAGLIGYMDLLYMPEEDKYKYLLVFVDACTKAVDFEPINKRDAETVKKALKTIIERGVLFKPFHANTSKNEFMYHTIISDAGSEFNNAEMKQMLKGMNTNLVITRAGRKSQTGLIESFNRLISEILQKKAVKEQYMHGGKKIWSIYIDKLREAINDDKTIKQELISDYFKLPRIKPKELLETGQKCLVRSEKPLASDGSKLSGPKRLGDIRYDMKYHIIENVLIFADGNTPRYLLNKMPNVSFLRSELILIDEEIIKKYHLIPA